LAACTPPVSGGGNNNNQCDSFDCNNFCIDDGRVSGSCEQSSNMCICSDRCTEHAQCERIEICSENDCESGFNREWVITVIDGTIPERNRSSGETWDAIGGAPDPYVVVTVDGEDCITRTKADTFTPSWNEECLFTLYNDSAMTISVMDEDIAEHDTIGQTSAEVITITTLREGFMQISWDDVADPLVRLGFRRR
jgi:hypothetical protein